MVRPFKDSLGAKDTLGAIGRTARGRGLFMLPRLHQAKLIDTPGTQKR